MDVDLIFRIAAVGILVAVLGQLLTRSGRDEQALMTTLAGIVVLALVLSLTLKKDAPVIAFLLVLAAGVVLLLRLGEAAQSTMQRFSALLARGDLSAELYGPVLRVVGIAVLVRILAALCRDAGQSALAAKVELAGTVLAFGAALPLLEQVLTFLTEWTV